MSARLSFIAKSKYARARTLTSALRMLIDHANIYMRTCTSREQQDIIFPRGPSLSEISYTCIEIPRNLQKSLRLCAKSRDPEESSQFDGKSPRNPEIAEIMEISQKSLEISGNLL